MNLQHAIDRHRKPLLRIVATLFAMAGLAGGAPAEKMAKPVYLAVLRLLRPAESAVRRLIVAAAREIVAQPPKPRAAPARPAATQPAASTPANPARARKPRLPAFQLFDPRRRVSAFRRYRRQPVPLRMPRLEPRIRVIDVGFDPRIPMLRNAAPTLPAPPLPPLPELDDRVSAVRLNRRLIALKAALDDLPRQAMRYARWQARPAATRRPRLASSLRPGRPPGTRRNPLHKVDRILSECDWLARRARAPDTS